MRRSPFFYRRRTDAERAIRPDLSWGVFELGLRDGDEKLVGMWDTRDAAREAARALNREEP
jgi:hypothetical protein